MTGPQSQARGEKAESAKALSPDIVRSTVRNLSDDRDHRSTSKTYEALTKIAQIARCSVGATAPNSTPAPVLGRMDAGSHGKPFTTSGMLAFRKACIANGGFVIDGKVFVIQDVSFATPLPRRQRASRLWWPEAGQASTRSSSSTGFASASAVHSFIT